MSINELIYCKIKEVIPVVYPVIADIDTGVVAPYAVYRVKTIPGIITKETVKVAYEVLVFIVCDAFDQAGNLAGETGKKFYELKEIYTVSPVVCEIKYVEEDRKYACEMSLTIKER